MPRPKNKKPKQQVKLWLEEQLIASLGEDVESFGFSSLPALIEEVLRVQYSTWKDQRLLYEAQGTKKAQPAPAESPGRAKGARRSSG